MFIDICDIKKWWIRNDGRAVTIGVFAVSFVAFFYYFICEPFNSDTYCVGLLKYSADTAGIQLGAWASHYYYVLSGHIVNPLLNHLIYTISVILASMLLNELWQISRKMFRVVAAMVLMVAPAVTGQLMYIYVYPTFGLAFLFAVLSVYCFFSSDNKTGVIISAVFMALSLGFYFIYISAILVIIVGKMVLSVFEIRFNSIVSFTKMLIRVVLFLGLGSILFGMVAVIHFKAYHTTRSGYSDIGNASFIGIIMNIPTYIKSTYRVFLSYYTEDKLMGNYMWTLLVCVALAFFCYMLFRLVTEHKYWETIAVFFLLLMIPPCANVMLFITPRHWIQLHWSYQMQLMAPFCMALIGVAKERIKDEKPWKGYIKKASDLLCMILFVALIVTYSYQTYSSIRTVDIGNRHVKYCVGNALTHALEDDVRTDDMPIVFMGFVDDREAQEWNPLIKYSYFDRAFPFWWDRYEVNTVWPNYCMYYFGVDIGSVSAEQYDNILNSSEFAAMEQYPSSKAYAVIDGCYVILMNRETVAE